MWKSFVIYLALFLSISTYAQKASNDSLADFDYVHFKEHLSELKDNPSRENYLQSVQRNFIKRKYNLVSEKNYIAADVSSLSCANSDFEFGNTSAWAIAGDFQIMSGSGLDPFGGFPVVCPGGNFSLRLNDNNTNCGGPNPKTNFKASATKTISLTSLNSLIKVNFAGCLLDFPHPQSAAAFIKIEFFDQFNVPIPTPSFSVCYASPPNAVVSTGPTTNSISALLGAQICSSVGSYQTRYFPWQTQGFNMSPYIGQNIILKLTANWCLYDYDWAYAYFDVCCDSTCPTIAGPYIVNSTTNNMCVNSSLNTTLCSATSTNINYNWYGSMGPMSTGSCITTSSIGSYTLHSVSPTNTVAINQEVFNLGLNPSVSFSVSNNVGCVNSSSGITLFVSPSGGTFFGPAISGNTFQPWVAGVGTYTISYVYKDPYAGCKDSTAQIIQVTHCKATNLEQNFKISELIIAPNPFKGEVFVQGKDIPIGSEFILFNCLGQEIFRKHLEDGKNTIETEGIPQGLYIYSIEQQNKSIKQGKLVKD